MSKKEVNALSGERQMVMPINSLETSKLGVSWVADNNWEQAAGKDVLFYEAYIDTSGYTREGLTVFPMGATLQDPGRYTSDNAAVPMQVVDIVSQVRLDPSLVYDWIVANNMPGMNGTDVDFIQILWGQYRTLLGQASFQGAATEFLTASAGLFGSGSPSTASKLYCYRFVILPGSTEGDSVSIPASRFVLSTIIAQEDELPFLMRQKRSYELAT